MKIRLDELLVQRGFVSGIKEARGLIGAGEVYVAEVLADKSGTVYPVDVGIRLKPKKKYVSRGAFKLEKALEHFNRDVTGARCADIGASSGGFTDCLLRRGAESVYAVDVAYGQFSWKLRQDPRVVVIERFNARNLSKREIPTPLDLAVVDVSFISLTRILPALPPLFTGDVDIIALVKPQFELPRHLVGTKGVVVDDTLHEQAIAQVISFAASIGLLERGTVVSPLLGPKGNKEFLLRLGSVDAS